MMSAATFAIVPAFLRFDVGAVGLEMGGAHGDYARLERCIVAPLLAISGQPIKSLAGNLGALKGRLLVVDAEDGNVEWNGSIRRSAISNSASDAADYVVHIDLTTLAFDRLAQLMTIGRTLSGLSLDFQNIDGPLNDDPLDRPIPWDDVQYPHVALTNFTLRWT